MTATIDEKLQVVEGFIETIRFARDMPPESNSHRTYVILKSIASEFRARREGAPAAAEVELGRRVTAVLRSKTADGYDERRLVALAQDVLGRWETIVQALRLFDEVAKLRASIDRYRYAYRWWQADSHDVGGEMRARFNWAAGEDTSDRLDANRIAEIGHEFLRATGRNTIKGKVVS